MKSYPLSLPTILQRANFKSVLTAVAVLLAYVLLQSRRPKKYPTEPRGKLQFTVSSESSNDINNSFTGICSIDEIHIGNRICISEKGLLSRREMLFI